MAEQHTGKKCKYCQKNVMAVRPGTNHVLHFLISLFTAGLWIPLWIWFSIKIGGWRCTQCGRRV